MFSSQRPRSVFSRGNRLAAFVVLSAFGFTAARAASAADGIRPENNVDVKLSRVYIYVGKTGLGHEHAVVGKLESGHVQLGAKRQAGELVFDMDSFVADTAEARKYIGLEGTTPASRQKEVTDNMLGAAVLDVAQHPTATYTIDSALPLQGKSKDGHPLYRLEGIFTLHGVDRPLDFDAEMIANDGTVRLRGSFDIRQTHYGIKPFSKAFGAVGVTDELTIHGDVILAAPRSANSRSAKRR